MIPNLCSGKSRDLSMNPTQMSRIQSNRPVKRKTSLWTSSPGRSGGKAGKGRRACNYVSGIWISPSKKSMWNAGYPCHVLFKVFLHSRSILLHTDWRKSDSSVDGEPQGNWRWNSHSRDIVASSRFFSRPTTRAPRRACSQARKKLKMSFNLEEFWSAI